MAAATVTQMEWGYLVTGDTGEATVNSGTIYVKAMAFSGNADNATCTITSKSPSDVAVSCYKFKTNANDLDCSGSHAFFGDKGVPFTDMKVTLSHASDGLYIFIK